MSDNDASPHPPAVPAHGVSLAEATTAWLKIAALSFGGPAGQIAVMHRIVVDEKRWVSEARFLHALNYCMLLPGPEAQQLATYLGWLMHGTRGGLIAGGLFILPGALAIMALSLIYVSFGQLDSVAAVFFGLKAAVLAIVLQAVARLGARALKTGAMRALAGLALISIFVFDLPFPLIVLGAGLIGWAGNALGLPGLRVPTPPTRRPRTSCRRMARQPRRLCGWLWSGWCCGWRRSRSSSWRSGPAMSSARSHCSFHAWRW